MDWKAFGLLAKVAAEAALGLAVTAAARKRGKKKKATDRPAAESASAGTDGVNVPRSCAIVAGKPGGRINQHGAVDFDPARRRSGSRTSKIMENKLGFRARCRRNGRNW